MKLFRKANSKFYWYDFTVRGQRYRGSTQENQGGQSSEGSGSQTCTSCGRTDPLPNKASTLGEFSERFLVWLTDARLESKTKTYYRNGWRMLKPTAVANMRVDEITADSTDRLSVDPVSG